MNDDTHRTPPPAPPGPTRCPVTSEARPLAAVSAGSGAVDASCEPGLEAGPETELAALDSPTPPLPLWLRITLLGIGWLLVLVGVAGLVLPGIQGIATILLGAAVLSLASELAYDLLERTCSRWPKLWNRLERFRAKTYRWIDRKLS